MPSVSESLSTAAAAGVVIGGGVGRHDDRSIGIVFDARSNIVRRTMCRVVVRREEELK